MVIEKYKNSYEPVLGVVLITVGGKCDEFCWLKKKTENSTEKTEAKMDASKEIFLFTTVFHFNFSPLPEDNRGGYGM